jgi:hypothetical protein
MKKISIIGATLMTVPTLALVGSIWEQLNFVVFGMGLAVYAGGTYIVLWGDK